LRRYCSSGIVVQSARFASGKPDRDEASTRTRYRAGVNPRLTQAPGSEDDRPGRGGLGTFVGVLVWVAVVLGSILYLGLYLFPLVPGCAERRAGLFDTVSGGAIGLGALGAILAIGWWALGSSTARRRRARLVRSAIVLVPLGTILVLGALVTDHACLTGGGLTYINRTTSPIAVADGDSRSIVEPCAQRTLGWQSTWGGNHPPESVPADAYVTSASTFRVGADSLPTITIVVTATQIGVQSRTDPDPQDIPCSGQPPSPRSTIEPSSPAAAPSGG
jgi:hypothetical protein